MARARHLPAYLPLAIHWQVAVADSVTSHCLLQHVPPEEDLALGADAVAHVRRRVGEHEDGPPPGGHRRQLLAVPDLPVAGPRGGAIRQGCRPGIARCRLQRT
jgi:hypothetical protein